MLRNGSSHDAVLVQSACQESATIVSGVRQCVSSSGTLPKTAF